MEIIDIAKVTHEANRAYCRTLGDESQLPWELAPEWQRKSACNGVAAVLSGEAKTPEDQHESWMRDKIADGWVFGEHKDAEKKTHPCLVPYAQLPVEQRLKDHLFRAVVVALSGQA